MKRIVREKGVYYIEVLAKETYRGRPTTTPEQWTKVDSNGWIIYGHMPPEWQNRPAAFHSLELAEETINKMIDREQPKEIIKVYE